MSPGGNLSGEMTGESDSLFRGAFPLLDGGKWVGLFRMVLLLRSVARAPTEIFDPPAEMNASFKQTGVRHNSNLGAKNRLRFVFTIFDATEICTYVQYIYVC